MKVSIVTAVYNREAAIGGAIDSVDAQSHAEIEHLVINGASTDGTLTAIEARRSPGMVLVSELDHCIYDTLDKGLMRSTGEVVGLLHSDDWFADTHVIARIAQASADPAVDAVHGDLDDVSATDPTSIVLRRRTGPASLARLRRG